MFIVIEGTEGAGKTTQARRLVQGLQGAGIDAGYLREPGGSPVGERIRELLLDPTLTINPTTSLLLFNASRAQFINDVVIPALAVGVTVVSDRSFVSTIAYQAWGEGVRLETARIVCRAAMGTTLPSHIFLLDLPTEYIEERLAKRGEARTRYEEKGVGFFECVRRGYLAEAELDPSNFTVLNARIDADALAHIILTKTLALHERRS